MQLNTAMKMPARTILTILAGAAVLVASAADASANTHKHRRSRRTHVVKRGQTLSKIAHIYDCKLASIKRANRKSLGRYIRPGQRLAIPHSCDRSPAQVPESKGGRYEVTPLVYKVRRGDNLGKIARRFDVSIRHIKRNNRIRKYLRIGQKLRIIPGTGGKGRPVPGQSIGWAHSGHLANAKQLPPSRYYYRRRPHFAWGATHTIHHIRRMVKYVRGKYRHLHKLAIGDISRKTGGHLTTHKSHQTGRDIDIGFYFKKTPSQYPESFAVGRSSNLHIPATFAMIRYLASTTRASGGVERIFLDTSVQKILYDYGRKHGVSKRTLDRIFQYPNGGGLVRAEPGHDNHLHVRFKCPRHDKKCH
jgi:LysM repeat protein/murein endopeptidase